MFEKKRKSKDFDMLYVEEGDELVLAAAYGRIDTFSVEQFIERMWRDLCMTGDHGSTLAEFRGKIKKEIYQTYMRVVRPSRDDVGTKYQKFKIVTVPTGSVSAIWFVNFNGYDRNLEKPKTDKRKVTRN